jgi:hypothetical protein
MMETINNTNVAFNFYAGCFLSICPKRSLWWSKLILEIFLKYHVETGLCMYMQVWLLFEQQSCN